MGRKIVIKNADWSSIAYKKSNVNYVQSSLGTSEKLWDVTTDGPIGSGAFGFKVLESGYLSAIKYKANIDGYCKIVAYNSEGETIVIAESVYINSNSNIIVIPKSILIEKDYILSIEVVTKNVFRYKNTQGDVNTYTFNSLDEDNKILPYNFILEHPVENN